MLTTTIAGIPCQVEISHTPAQPAGYYGEAVAIDPPEEEEFEVVAVYDRRGYPAPWLARKMTEEDAGRIYDEYVKLTEECY